MSTTNTSSTSITEDRRYRSKVGAHLGDLAGQVRAVLADVHPEDIPKSWAPEVLDAFIDIEKLGAAGRVLMAARAVEAKDLSGTGFASPADWLAHEQGTSTGRARADLGTSNRLSDLAATADELRSGNLSAEQAQVIADAAVVNPAAENDLIALAKRDSLRHTREEADRRKAQVLSEQAKQEREAQVRTDRKVRIYTKNGEGRLFATGPKSVLADIEQILNERVGRTFRERRDPASRESVDNYRFDALIDLILTGENGGAIDPSDDAGSSRKRKRRAPARRLGLVRVDLATLTRGFVGDGEVCEIPGYGPVSVAEATDLLGDSVLAIVLTHGEAVAGVVNLSRKLTVAQELAKVWQSPKCCVQGCNRTVCLQFDHRDDWARTHVTCSEGIDRPCNYHHLKKTVEGWAMVPGTGRRPMVPPGHPQHPGTVAQHRPEAGSTTGPVGPPAPAATKQRTPASSEALSRAARAVRNARTHPDHGDIVTSLRRLLM